MCHDDDEADINPGNLCVCSRVPLGPVSNWKLVSLCGLSCLALITQHSDSGLPEAENREKTGTSTE